MSLKSLQRFSAHIRNSGVSSAASTATATATAAAAATSLYSESEVNSALKAIKSLGKNNSSVNNIVELRDIETILALSRKYKHSLYVQRVTCHALSNIAMQVQSAQWILEKGGYKTILSAIDRFTDDYKLCWLASSAVWNLARPQQNRSKIGESGVLAMLKILSKHSTREKVVNTAIGALSNLSLNDDLKDLVADQRNLTLVLHALRAHLQMRSLAVLTSGAGLLANLAVNDEHASVLVSNGVLSLLIRALTWEWPQLESKAKETGFKHWTNPTLKPKTTKTTDSEHRWTLTMPAHRATISDGMFDETTTNSAAVVTESRDRDNDSESDTTERLSDDTLYRNTCAALNNLVTAQGFTDSFLTSLCTERVFLFLQRYSSNELYSNLLENCLREVSASPDTVTTSFHLLSRLGRVHDLKALYSEYRHSFHLNARDGKGHTCLDYAIAEKQYDTVEWLCKCGASQWDRECNATNDRMAAVMSEGKSTLTQVKEANAEAIIDTLPSVPVDLCKFFVSFTHNVDLLQGLNQY